MKNRKLFSISTLKMRGFSIVELMIGITLGTLVIASTISIYITNKATHQVQEGLARLQENARYATYYLNSQIRMAGFQGCASESFVTINNLVKDPTKILLYNSPLLGFEGNGANFNPVLPTYLAVNRLPIVMFSKYAWHRKQMSSFGTT